MKHILRLTSLILALVLVLACFPALQASAAQTQTPASGSYVRIRYAANGKYLDVPADGIQKNGTQLQVWDLYPDNQNQVFQLINTENGWQILSKQSGKCIEVRNASHSDYAQVAQWDRHSHACAHWDIVPHSDGSVSFRNRESGKYLNVRGGGNASNGTRIIQYHDDSSVSMRFFIETVTADGSGLLSGMTDVTAAFAGKTITMQSVENGKYLCADSELSGTPLMANRDTPSTWETFTVSELTSDGWVGIRAHNGKYLTANIDAQYAPLVACYDHLQAWECFRIYQLGADFYIRAQANGNWFSVRLDRTGTPVQTCTGVASTWERLALRVVNKDAYISDAEISATAAANGIAPGTDAYKALESLNSVYAAQLSASEKRGTVVAMFEGVGSDASPSRRMNAMCVVIRNGDILYIDRSSSTIPDRPFDPTVTGVRYNGTSTVRSGIYEFYTVNHKGYAALRLRSAKSVRHTSKTAFNADSATGIDIHRRYRDTPYTANGGSANSSGCMIVGKTGTASTAAYARFIQALGIVGPNATATASYTNSLSGTFILDRTWARDYLRGIGYTDQAITLIG